jgi:DNA-binding XRE family transcriptional regulator
MSKRKPMDKTQARERRNRLLESAAAAELSLTEGVREMRAIADMTQEEFARHRGVSARVIKALELGQGNPTVATLNRIGQFFGLEVAFVPVGRPRTNDKRGMPADTGAEPIAPHLPIPRNDMDRRLANAIKVLHDQLALLDDVHKDMRATRDVFPARDSAPEVACDTPTANDASSSRKKKHRSS